MEDIRRRKTYACKGLGRDVELVELSYKAQSLLIDCYSNGRPSDSGPIMVRYGVTEFHDTSEDEIAEMLTLPIVVELSEAVGDFSGIGDDEEKKSESAQT